MSQNEPNQLYAELFKKKGAGIDDAWHFACCFCLYGTASPKMTTPIPALLSIVNDESYSDQTRVAALAVLSQIGGKEIVSALISAKPLSRSSRAGKEVRAAIFDVIAGKIVPLGGIEDLVKPVNNTLINVRLTLPKLKALSTVSGNRKLRGHLMSMANGLEGMAKELRQGL